MNSEALVMYRYRISPIDYLILIISLITVAISSHYARTIEFTTPEAAVQSNSKVTPLKTIQIAMVIPDMANASIQKQVIEERRTLETLEKQVRQDIENERIAAIKEYISSIVCDPNDISKVSNLNAEDFSLLTKGTWWEGNEQALVDLEKNHHINAMFAMSVSSLESGKGKSDRAKIRKNFYGMEIGKIFSGLYDCTQYWGNLMSEKYVGSWHKISVWNIGPTYCPPNRAWETYMNSSMIGFYNNLISNMESTML